jgi:hypothetical protein
MRKVISAIVFSTVLAVASVGTAFGAAGGAPAVHGVDGRTFGGLVANLAQADTGALVSHVSGR